MSENNERRHHRTEPRLTRRLRASRELPRWRGLLAVYGREEMSHDEIGELRRLAAAIGGRRAIRALGLT